MNKLIGVVGKIARLSSNVQLSIRWWRYYRSFVWACRIFILALALLVLGIVLWHSWAWIGRNSAQVEFVVTGFTGLALAFFAWQTYRLSNKMAELRYAPVLELHSVKGPEVGMFDEGDLTYDGVRWEIGLTNPGDVPIWAESMSIEIKLASPEGIWEGIVKLCELLDESSNLLDRTIGVEGKSQRKVVVFLCQEDKGKDEHKRIRPGDRVIMAVNLYQQRRLGKEAGWGQVLSGEFRFPSKFGKSPKPLILV